MKETALLALIFTTAVCPALARPYAVHQNNSGAHSAITCEMVRSYVAQVGVAQAKAMAQAAGMTAADEMRARRCLTHKA